MFICFIGILVFLKLLGDGDAVSDRPHWEIDEEMTLKRTKHDAADEKLLSTISNGKDMYQIIKILPFPKPWALHFSIFMVEFEHVFAHWVPFDKCSKISDSNIGFEKCTSCFRVIFTCNTYSRIPVFLLVLIKVK